MLCNQKPFGLVIGGLINKPVAIPGPLRSSLIISRSSLIISRSIPPPASLIICRWAVVHCKNGGGLVKDKAAKRGRPLFLGAAGTGLGRAATRVGISVHGRLIVMSVVK